MQRSRGMRVIVRRRADGIVQIRRAPRWRSFFHPVAAAVLCMAALCGAGIAGLTAMLIAFPRAVAVTLPFLALGAWGAQLARAPRAAAPATDPPPRRAA